MRPGLPVLPYEADWVTARQFAACLGNTMSCNVLVHLLPEVLVASGLVSRRRAEELRQKAASLFPGNVCLNVAATCAYASAPVKGTACVRGQKWARARASGKLARHAALQGCEARCEAANCRAARLQGHKAARPQGCRLQDCQLQDCKAARLQDCRAARLQGCKAARLQGCKTARLQDCKAASCNTARLQGCKAARLQGCRAARLQGCRLQAARWQGCKAARLRGCKASRLQGCILQDCKAARFKTACAGGGGDEGPVWGPGPPAGAPEGRRPGGPAPAGC